MMVGCYSFLCLWLLLLAVLLYNTLASPEKDIYHVITGEDDLHLPKNLNPLFYVGIYDEKPSSIPDKFDIEIMTSKSGDKYTCLIPVETFPSTKNSNTDIIQDKKQITDEVAIIDEIHLNEEKSNEELLQEWDTIANRISYLSDIIQNLDSKQTHGRKVRRRLKNQKRSSNSCFEHRDGYWTYDICLFENILQYHGRHKSPSFNLGEFTDYINVAQYLMEGKTYEWYEWIAIYDQSLFTADDKYLHVLFTDGDEQRTSLISILCPENGKGNGIAKFSEPQKHFYHFVLAFAPICNYAQYLEMQVNADTNANNNILHSLLRSQPLSSTISEIDMSSDDIALLLSPLDVLAKDNKCLTLNQGWWMVEFCYGEHIRQVHYETEQMIKNKETVVKRIMTQENMLGLWSGEVLNESYSIVIHEKDNSRTYAKILYSGGDFCEVSKKKRKSEIQFRCGTSSEYSMIISSREDPSCEYIVQIETPLICQHPAFEIAIAPSLEIVCYPLASDDWQASDMKMVADVQSEYDEIVKIVNNAAIYNAYERKQSDVGENFAIAMENDSNEKE